MKKLKMYELYVMGEESPFSITPSEVELMKQACANQVMFEVERLGLIVNPKSISRVKEAEYQSFFLRKDGKLIETYQIDAEGEDDRYYIREETPGGWRQVECTGDPRLVSRAELLETKYYGYSRDQLIAEVDDKKELV